MSAAEKAAKVALDEEEVLVAGSAFPAAVEDDITVYYYPSKYKYFCFCLSRSSIRVLIYVLRHRRWRVQYLDGGYDCHRIPLLGLCRSHHCTHLVLIFIGFIISLEFNKFELIIYSTTRDEASGCKRKPSQSGGGPATEVRIHKSTNRPNTTRTEATALQEDVEK